MSVGDEEFEFFGTRPAISRTFSPIVRNISFAQIQQLSDSKTGRNCKYYSESSSTNDCCGQHDTSYYQPQPPFDYNQRQRYRRLRGKKAPYMTLL